ncbi:MAG: phosphoribosylanthranilate isomerase [Gemmatimonadetes bacterium]|nr:phosphoribosylanthranilate isomerase [Gemmatimonadota bacterium]
MVELGVKICGLMRRADAEVAAAAGADYLGAVLTDASPRRVTAKEARALAGGLGATLACVFVNQSLRDVVEAARVAGAGIIQLHGEEAPDEVAAVRASGRWRVWKVIRLRDTEEFGLAVERYVAVVDGVLVEGWDARRRGGAGARFAWERVAAARDVVPPGIELIVAGGLTPNNVGEAVERLRPQVVDVSSGVESSPGRKDPVLVRRFVAAARAAGVGAP